MKRILSIALAALMCLGLLLGCAAGAELPAAKVGETTISVSQLQNMYYNNSGYASFYGYTLADDAGIEAFQDYLLDMLVETRVKQYKAEQAGVGLSPEELEEAKAVAEASYEETYQSFLDAAEQAGAGDVEAYAKQLLTDALVSNHTTIKKMKQGFLDEAKADLMIAKHREQLLSGVAPTAEELKTLYDEQLSAQQLSFDADPAAYFAQESNYAYGYGYMPLYVPEGLFRVRHILTEDEAAAKEALEKVKAGEDFDALITAYNTDPGMDATPEGYLVGPGANFVENFLNAALALEKDGDVSDIVKSDYGYHIIKRVSTEPGGVIPYEEIKDSFDAFATAQYSENYYNDLLNTWKAEDGLVTYYEENYRGIGKAA